MSKNVVKEKGNIGGETGKQDYYSQYFLDVVPQVKQSFVEFGWVFQTSDTLCMIFSMRAIQYKRNWIQLIARDVATALRAFVKYLSGAPSLIT